MTAAVVLALMTAQVSDPVAFGRRDVAAATGRKAPDVQISIKPGKQKEAYTIKGDGQKVAIVGTDANGAMYGALEFAERVRNEGDKAWKTEAKGSPFLADRGLNLFLTLPWNYQKNDTDYDTAALTDPDRWWFHNEDYWTTLLDLMAHSRLNWLDIHGGWDISVTNAPNLYAYFVTSPSFPKVGVSDEIKAKDLAQLNHIIDMAHARGIRVSLMAYEANLKIPQNPNPPYEATEANIYKYTAEVVEQMIRKAPGLDAIGYRIGESGKGESFFHCYGEAVKKSGREIPIVTRSWITTKQNVLPLARASKDFTVEIKYNGEQWGAPYMVAGGRVANWYSYSFEDYLSDSGAKGAKTWPGNPADGGGNWPDQPYKVVWQVRANGTHRIFPFYNPDWVRRSISCMKIGTASGYTIEGEDAYYPKEPTYYMADSTQAGYKWIHQRDEMYWTTWGRLGYDPSTPDSTFDKQANRMLGGGADDLIANWKDASTLISKAFMAYSLGPDHRNHAPELEWGGDTAAYIEGQPFDSLSFLPINEELANHWTGGRDGRVSPYEVGRHLGSEAGKLTVSEGATTNPLCREISHAIVAMGRRATYNSGRMLSATALGASEGATGEQMRFADPFCDPLKIQEAAKAHRQLAEDPFYRPFTERLRMHTNTFAWATEDKQVQAEADRISKLPLATSEVPLIRSGGGGGGPSKDVIEWRVEGSDVVCAVKSKMGEEAWLLEKPLPSSTFIHSSKMRRVADHFEARFPRLKCGHVIAIELKRGDSYLWRSPSVLDQTPYIVIPSQPGPTPQIYSSAEALTFLDPASISPDKHGAILIGSRANDFFRFDNASKRKLLDPVARGMKLVILQEDFSKDKLDFLPKPLKRDAFASEIFDPGGQLGLEKVQAPGIMWNRFLPSDGWEVFGNGGLARLKIGKGEVWVTTARLMQTMQYPTAAKALVGMLGVGGKSKPTILVDSCSEGGSFTSSCHPDLMNSHDIPFLTLGEVIAKEQGMNEYTVIPGKVADDDVLGGSGQAMLNKVFRDQVVQASKLPTPASMAAFEKERVRRKAELMRSLGLDPMPPKTPLNARVTGTIQGDGYHVDKVVFESRPKFYVTAHVYVPEGTDALDALDAKDALRRENRSPSGHASNPSKYPVVVHVNGHWAHKKDEDRIQLRCQFCAKQGYIAIAIDSPGWSFEGNSLIERRPEGDHNDFFLVEGGSNTTGYYVWDAIRALDYMATRPDTDMSRIGLTGASGGGLATLYTFAADDRYTAAVPVVYMSSMELAPDNGCLCNHVPGTSQIGDRSDVIAIQAPKPVFIFGAQNDGEFPPPAMLLTHKKMAESWKLFGKENDVRVNIFDGPHDYNQLMREQMIGFFNKYLKGQGDGSPVPQPTLKAIDPEDHQLLALDPPTPGERTMRDLSQEYLANAPQNVDAKTAIALNGGVPKRGDLKYKETPVPGSKGKFTIRFESEPGLVTPGILVLPTGAPKAVEIVAADEGKAASLAAAANGNDGVARLYIDVLGTGELATFEMRYLVYLGTSAPFKGGWQIVQAAKAMAKYSKKVHVRGDGPISGQAAMWAGLMDPSLSITCDAKMTSWADVFKNGVSEYAVQPRAHLMGSLQHLMALVKLR